MTFKANFVLQNFSDQTFKAIQFDQNPLHKGEYENCTFNHCHLGGADLSNFIFIDCVFSMCDLSNVKLKNTALRTVTFEGCKMIGLHFEDCAAGLFSVAFDGCQLQLSSFHGHKMKAGSFTNCRLNESNFSDCDLRKADFSHAELQLARFDNCQLEEADFREASGLEIDPDRNRLKGAHFNLQQLPALLTKYQIRVY